MLREKEERVGEERERKKEKEGGEAGSQGLRDCDKTGRTRKDGLEKETDEEKERWRGGVK